MIWDPWELNSLYDMLYRTDMAVTDIARHYKMQSIHIRQALWRMNWKLPMKKYERKINCSEEMVHDIYSMFEAGKSNEQIVKKLKISRFTVRDVLAGKIYKWANANNRRENHVS